MFVCMCIYVDMHLCVYASKHVHGRTLKNATTDYVISCHCRQIYWGAQALTLNASTNVRQNYNKSNNLHFISLHKSILKGLSLLCFCYLAAVCREQQWFMVTSMCSLRSISNANANNNNNSYMKYLCVAFAIRCNKLYVKLTIVICNCHNRQMSVRACVSTYICADVMALPGVRFYSPSMRCWATSFHNNVIILA